MSIVDGTSFVKRNFSIRICGVIVLLFIGALGYGQKEHSTWYFGRGAGLDFNTGIPVPIDSGRVWTDEACASISDKNGNLLFYTDGRKVWNKFHDEMPNGTGLLGDKSSTQIAVFRKPGSINRYLIFTVDLQADTHGLNYSEVNMNANNGLGEVTTTKNVQLHTPICEHITMALHANKKDVWVIAHEYGNNTFQAYLVSCSTGVNSVPIRSNAGSVLLGGGVTRQNAAGMVRSSPDGKKLAVINRFKDELQLFDFDNTTGEISNTQTIRDDYGVTPNDAPYGVEFSPSGKLLYVSLIGPGNIYQYDLDAANIRASEIIVGKSEYPCALQIGPDKKIYIAENWEAKISVINNPDVVGLGCNFVANTISLGQNSFGQDNKSHFGLPSYLGVPVSSCFSYSDSCQSKELKFIGPVITYDSLFWDFGDPSSDEKNTSTVQNPVHTFTDSGTFLVSLTIYDEGLPIVNEELITIYPENHLNSDGITICEKERYIFVANSFTPNGDGINDLIYPVFSSSIPVENFEFQVFDRWGKAIFETSDYSQGWDGRFKNKKKCPSGLYTYLLSYKSKTEDKKLLGRINLIK